VTTALRLLILAGVQTAALAGLVGWREAVLATGAPVVLETAPVDPRSLFQGDYVILQFAISRIDLSRFGADTSFREGDPIHVVMAPGDPVWNLVGIHRDWPSSRAADTVVIRGRVDQLTDWCGPGEEAPCPRRAWISYGIESYFVPEGTGEALEQLRGTDELRVRIAVSPFGTPAVAALVVRGKEWAEEGIF